MTPAIVSVMTPAKVGSVSKGTTRRSIRIDDDLWNAAKKQADASEQTVSDFIRRALDSYVEEDNPQFSEGYWLGFNEALDAFKNWLTMDGAGEGLHEVVVNKVLLKVEGLRANSGALQAWTEAQERNQ